MLAIGRVSASPPMSCLFGIRCHATFDGIHSVANIEYSRVAPVAPQSGQGGGGDEAETSSSKRVPHPSQRYSYIGMGAQSSRLEFLRAQASAQGVSPSDGDLAAALGFLDRILPELDRLEATLRPDERPAGPEPADAGGGNEGGR